MALSKAFEKKNVLVTGGAGFIGSHLCERLVHENAHVICLDNFQNSTPANIEHILTNQDFAFLNVDVNDNFDLDSFQELERFKIKFQGIQEIYHLACPTSAKNFNEFKIQTLRSNSDGTKNILDLAVKHKSKVVVASSSVIYGPRSADRFQFQEDSEGIVNHLSPRACYDEGKRFIETMGSTYADVYRLDVKLARIFRTYGPRLKLDDGQMLIDFIVKALAGEDLVIYGDKDFKTSLTFVSDVVDGLIKFMATKTDKLAMNFGTDYEYNLTDVAQKIIDAMKSKSKITFEPPLPFITELGIPDLTRAKETIGWFPLVTLDDGLKQTIDYTIANQGRLGIS